LGLGIGYVCALAGLTLNAVRALRVRRILPPDRYRGPAVLVLLLLAIILSLPASLLFAEDVAVIVGAGGEPTLLGSAVILTATQVALLGVAVGFVLWPRALPDLHLLPAARAGRSLASGIALGIPVWLLATTVGAITAAVLLALGIEPDPQPVEQAIGLVHPAIIIASYLILTPVAEELFFRGVVLNAWWREYGWRGALIGSSVLWTLIHGSLLAFAPILIVGLALGAAYRRTRSLLTVIGMHATFNAISVALTLAVNEGLIQLPV